MTKLPPVLHALRLLIREASYFLGWVYLLCLVGW